MSIRRTVTARRAAVLAMIVTAVCASVGAAPTAAQAGGSVVPVSDVAYGSDALQRMDIYPGADSAPTVVVVHGGGWSGHDKLSTPIRVTAEDLSARGFAVFNLDFRMSSPRVVGYPMMTDDISSAVDWVRRNGPSYGADIDNITIIGGSSGAQLALRSAQLSNLAGAGTVRNVVSLSGPTDFVLANTPTNGPPRSDDDPSGINAYLGCRPSVCTPTQEQAPSPAYNIDPATCPATMLLNSDDELVPTEQLTRMDTALAAAGCSTSATIVPGQAHGFDLYPPFADQIADFIRGPVPPPVPELTIADTEVTEGPGVSAQVTVRLDPPAQVPETVSYTTRDGSALAGTDYVPGSGEVTIEAGTTEAVIPVDIIDDLTVEDTERFEVVLTSAGDAAVTADTAEVTVEDDDRPPPPTATGTSPASLVQGDGPVTVTVFGANFTAGTAVSVDTTAITLTDVVVVDTQTLQATGVVDAATNPGTHTLTVTNPDGQVSVCTCLTIRPRFTVTGATPAMGTPGGKQTVLVTGSGFLGGATVGFGLHGVTATTVVVSDTELRATVTVTVKAALGARAITVTNGPGVTASCAACFTVVPKPTVNGLSPATVVRSASYDVTIEGTGFIGGQSTEGTPALHIVGPSGVTFAAVLVVDATHITARMTVARRAAAAGLKITISNVSAGPLWKASCSCLTVTIS